VAATELLPLVCEELRILSANKLANQPPGQTLPPTALVHEAAEGLGIPESAAKRAWADARAWLYHELSNSG
jgi:hypothetical protein